MDREQPPPPDLPPAPPVDTTPGVDIEPPPPPGRRRTVAIAAGIVAAVALAGGVGVFLLLRGTGEQLLDKLPADTDVVLTVYLDPSAGQKVNLLRMADEIPSLGSSEEITRQIEGALDEPLSILGLTHEDMDWVGSQIAIGVNVPETDPPGDALITVLIASDDEAAASRTMAKLRGDPATGEWQREDHDGIEVWVGSQGPEQQVIALIDGAVAFSNSSSAIDDVIAASRGDRDTLAGSTSFQEATADLPEGKLALAYADPAELSAFIENMQPTVFDPSVGSTSQSLEGFTGMAMSVSAEEDGLAMDVQVTFDPEKLSPVTRETLTAPAHENPLLAGIPSDALMVMSQQGLRATFEGFLEQIRQMSPETAASMDDGFVEAMTGDLAIAAMPTGEADLLSGVLMVGTSDEAAMRDAISAFVHELEIPRSKWETTDHGGVEVTTFVDRKATTPYVFSYAVFDGAAVLGASPEAVFEAIDARGSGPSIVDDERYLDAMSGVPSGGGSIYADIDGLASTIRGQLPPGQVEGFDASVGETMDHLDAFVMGTGYSDTSAHVRMVLRVG
ncbi:MAG TPA: DUF3352 domain-containing protein [Actinomycetota bacterium]